MKLHRLMAFATLCVALLCARGASAAIIINEIDSDSVNTPTTDHAEFIELYSTTGGVESLDGLSILLINGNGEVTYTAGLDLDGQSTDANGFYLIASNSVPAADNYALLGAGNILQNGPDAVGLYMANAADFPAGTAATTANLVDAIVYGTNDAADPDLLAAMGETVQFDEGSTGTISAANSLARVPNGTGDFVSTAPTPGVANIPEPATLCLTLMSSLGLLAVARRR
jgi:hypothetical protein